MKERSWRKRVVQHTKRRRFYRCGRKVGFNFAADAREAMTNLISRGESGLHVYKHSRCGGHHVGHFQ
jgi:hypothetical protein